MYSILLLHSCLPIIILELTGSCAFSQRISHCGGLTAGGFPCFPPNETRMWAGMQKTVREADEVFGDTDEGKTQARFELGMKGWEEHV
ncbi:hypothetical protein AVEN_210153-1 [Araneus ventricosus]|uniref:Uncharacterized protein n=1 Tax=Araneus ventricosus TaxID=182803 RepID=A0A4Y2PVD0_ARAVE|nr:hypothetical protein AVEN_210153-1 [Araneus ventricosus]